MTKNTTTSVKNAIKILRFALKKTVSLSEASRQNNFGRNYVSDVKSRIKNNYKAKRVSREDYTTFNTLIKEYSK